MELLLCTSIGLHGKETTGHVILQSFCGWWGCIIFLDGHFVKGKLSPTPQEALNSLKRRFPKYEPVSKRVFVKAATVGVPCDNDKYSFDGIKWEDVKENPVLPLLTLVYEDCEITGNIIIERCDKTFGDGFIWWAEVNGQDESSFDEDPFPTIQEALDDFKQKFSHYVVINTEYRVDLLLGTVTVVPGASHG